MDFYSYLWLREDGTPYYVGKGHGNRAFSNKGRSAARCPRVRNRIMIFPMLNEAEAFESEVAMIDLFGRKDLGTGCLWNFTNGGDGQSNPSQAARKKMAAGGRIGGDITGRKNVQSGGLASLRTPDHQRTAGIIGGCATNATTHGRKGNGGRKHAENGTGIFAMTHEQRISLGRTQGYIRGRKNVERDRKSVV